MIAELTMVKVVLVEVMVTLVVKMLVETVTYGVSGSSGHGNNGRDGYCETSVEEALTVMVEMWWMWLLAELLMRSVVVMVVLELVMVVMKAVR